MVLIVRKRCREQAASNDMKWLETVKYPKMADVAPKPIDNRKRLDTWKQIAEYLNNAYSGDVNRVFRRSE